MIGRLTGTLAIKRAPEVLVECHGVGYEVQVSMTTFYQLPAQGEAVSLWTHLLVKEDQHALVGFYSEAERGLFRQLIKVNGVGPKMGLTILSGISDTDFALCVQSNNVTALTRLPGVGKKTAGRLITFSSSTRSSRWAATSICRQQRELRARLQRFQQRVPEHQSRKR